METKTKQDKNWQFDLRKCPDCNLIQTSKLVEGSKCEGADSPIHCDSIIVVCKKGKNKGKLMWSNENWE